MDVNPNLKHSRLASKPLSLAITYRPVDGLKLDPANPRRHSRAQIRQIANSIEVFGFNVPILIALASAIAGKLRTSQGSCARTWPTGRLRAAAA